MGTVGKIIFADNLEVLRSMEDASIDLIYIDPPFNTGTIQECRRIRTVADNNGDRIGFGNKRYHTITLDSISYADKFEDYYAFLRPRLEEAHRMLAPHGSIYVHLDYREAHYIKVMLDGIFGRDAFINEIIWAYDYGGRSRRRWPTKHDTILFYAKDPEKYIFNID